LVEEIPIRLADLTEVVDSDGKTIIAMENKGKVAMTSETYKKLSGWNVTWHGFN